MSENWLSSFKLGLLALAVLTFNIFKIEVDIVIFKNGWITNIRRMNEWRVFLLIVFKIGCGMCVFGSLASQYLFSSVYFTFEYLIILRFRSSPSSKASC